MVWVWFGYGLHCSKPKPTPIPIYFDHIFVVLLHLGRVCNLQVSSSADKHEFKEVKLNPFPHFTFLMKNSKSDRSAT